MSVCKSRKDVCRRRALRRGYRLRVSKRLDPLATDYGLMSLTDLTTGVVVLRTTSIEEVNTYLDTPRR
jgi:hypothetical protein